MEQKWAQVGFQQSRAFVVPVYGLAGAASSYIEETLTVAVSSSSTYFYRESTAPSSDIDFPWTYVATLNPATGTCTYLIADDLGSPVDFLSVTLPGMAATPFSPVVPPWIGLNANSAKALVETFNKEDIAPGTVSDPIEFSAIQFRQVSGAWINADFAPGVAQNWISGDALSLYPQYVAEVASPPNAVRVWDIRP